MQYAAYVPYDFNNLCPTHPVLRKIVLDKTLYRQLSDIWILCFDENNQELFNDKNYKKKIKIQQNDFGEVLIRRVNNDEQYVLITFVDEDSEEIFKLLGIK